MDPVAQLNQNLTGRYEIEKEIGAGGMATVFLARDVRHNRHVALKLLKPDSGVVLGADRFSAEVQVTVNCRHPNLLPLFDSGEAGGLLFYVMPFVEGETLRARLDREKQLPVDEAVRITVAIGNALAYAHSHGVIHRDLKPENILMQAGQPVIADFGIALAVSNAGGARITQTGLSLGTPLYMSPEQATGDRAIDARTDVYSLAAMLYEMLAGDPPHTASTSQGIIAKVLTDRPRSVRGVRTSVPEHVEAAIDRALEKLPADRWSGAQEFVDALQGRGYAGSTAQTAAFTRARAAAARPRLRDPLFLTVAVIAVGALAGLAILSSKTSRAEAPATVRFALESDTAATPVFAGTWSVLPSPDGRSVLYTARVKGSTQLFIRRLDQLEARALPGTERAVQPLFSPDGKWVAFLVENKLKKVSLEGGMPASIAEAGSQNGADWITDDLIVFGADMGFKGLSVISADGGKATELTKVDSTKGEGQHLWPVSLADGKTIVFAIYDGTSKLGSKLAITSLKDGKVTNLGVSGIAPVGVFNGRLLYMQADGTMLAVPIDVAGRKITGNPVPVLDSITVCGQCNGDAAVHASRAGALAYMRGSTLSRLVWVEKGGAVRNIRPELASYSMPRLSPDGSRVAVEINRGDSDIWILTLANGTLSRLTTGGKNSFPEWSPNGKFVLFNFIKEGTGGGSVWWQSADGGSKPAQLTGYAVSGGVLNPDATALMYSRFGSSVDLYVKAMGDTSAATSYLETPNFEAMPNFSADGKWVAYTSDVTGSDEVYVRLFKGDGGRVQISAGGGTEPRWSRDGRRIFYRWGRRMMAANVSVTSGVAVVSRDTLFEGSFERGSNGAGYDVSRDGQRFLMLQSNIDQMQVVVVTNWVDELKTRLGKK